MKKNYAMLCALVMLWGSLSGCAVNTPVLGGPVAHERLVDGVYEGSAEGGPNKATVKVTIEDQKIVDIEVLEHKAMLGKKAEPIVPQRMIDAQSTDVDAVSGATNSSKVLMNAVQDALVQAYRSE